MKPCHVRPDSAPQELLGIARGHSPLDYPLFVPSEEVPTQLLDAIERVKEFVATHQQPEEVERVKEFVVTSPQPGMVGHEMIALYSLPEAKKQQLLDCIVRDMTVKMGETTVETILVADSFPDGWLPPTDVQLKASKGKKPDKGGKKKRAEKRKQAAKSRRRNRNA